MGTLQELEDYLAQRILSQSGLSQHRAGNVSKQELAPFLAEISKISQAYVEHTVGSFLPSPIRSLRAAQAYALYYTPINAAKIIHLLPMLELSRDGVRVLDIGCGPGTAGLALLSAGSTTIELTCIEQAPEMRALAGELLRNFRGKAELKSLTLKPELSLSNTDKYDVIIAANIFAEIEETQGEQLLLKLAQHLAPGGYLLVIEPGQQAHTRRLMQLRDLLLTSNKAIVPVFPCLRRDRCPMLQTSPSDWCHGTLEWPQPRISAQIDRLLSFNKHRIKYSAFIFQNDGAIKDGVRVIIPAKKNRTGIEALVCGKDHYGTIRIRKGARSPGTRALEKAAVFDRLLVSEPCSGDAPDGVTFTPTSA